MTPPALPPLHAPDLPGAPALTPLQMVLAAVILVLLLWVAYRVGKIILRIVAGLIFLGLAGYGIWYLFIR